MNSYLKMLWHEGNAFISGFVLYLLGNKAEKAAAKGSLFEFKFVNQNKYIKRLEELGIETRTRGNFNRIQIRKNIYYWPAKANLDSLKVVLAEALFPDHPHYYDSQSTLLENGDRVLDIGACEGAFTLHAAAKNCKVVAVEPSNTMIQAIKLAANEQNFDNIKYITGLVSSTNTDVGFQENLDFPEASMIVDIDKASEVRKCWTLDSFIEEHFPDGIDYIKCDAEGADFGILESGKNTILKFKPKISVASYHHQHDFKKMQKLLEEIGYNVIGQGLHYSPVLHKCFPVLLKAHYSS